MEPLSTGQGNFPLLLSKDLLSAVSFVSLKVTGFSTTVLSGLVLLDPEVLVLEFVVVVVFFVLFFLASSSAFLRFASAAAISF